MLGTPRWMIRLCLLCALSPLSLSVSLSLFVYLLCVHIIVYTYILYIIYTVYKCSTCSDEGHLLSCDPCTHHIKGDAEHLNRPRKFFNTLYFNISLIRAFFLPRRHKRTMMKLKISGKLSFISPFQNCFLITTVTLRLLIIFKELRSYCFLSACGLRAC